MSQSSTASITTLLVGGRETKHLRVPKQILPFGDTTVLGRTMKAYIEAGFAEILIVLGYKADAIAAELGTLPPGVRIVRNPLFDEGMSSFLRAGLRELPPSSRGFCVGLQDQPLLNAELLREFADAFAAAKKPILVPAYQGSLGLPVFFQSAMAEEVSSLRQTEDLWDVMKRHGGDVHDHSTGYSAVVRSIEDMDDYHAMLRSAKLPIPEPQPAPPPPEPEPEPATEVEPDPNPA
jgi:molybdenum cofactor cytidylyltransferase